MGGYQGIKRVLEREIQISSSTILSAIDMEFKNGKAGSVAKEFLEQSKQCFQEFVNWSESFFLEKRKPGLWYWNAGEPSLKPFAVFEWLQPTTSLFML